MNSEDIFIKQDSNDPENITKKLTKTSILNTIPPSAVNKPMDNWEEKYNTEWRWRFLKYNNSEAVEISYLNKGKDRMYYNKLGKWVKRNIPKCFDKIVEKEYYYYA